MRFKSSCVTFSLVTCCACILLYITEQCKRRAAESSSAEEMAMHRVLAEHMFKLHGNSREIDQVQREMIRAAGRI